MHPRDTNDAIVLIIVCHIIDADVG